MAALGVLAPLGTAVAATPSVRAVGEPVAIKADKAIGDLLVIDSKVEIAGVVRGHVYAIDSNIMLRSSAVILGPVNISRGRLSIERGAVLPATIDLVGAHFTGPDGETLQVGEPLMLGDGATRVVLTAAVTGPADKPPGPAPVVPDRGDEILAKQGQVEEKAPERSKPAESSPVPDHAASPSTDDDLTRGGVIDPDLEAMLDSHDPPPTGQGPARAADPAQPPLPAQTSRGSQTTQGAEIRATAAPTATWWEDKPTPRAEDFLLSLQTSSAGDAELHGVGAEFYATDMLGLRLSVLGQHSDSGLPSGFGDAFPPVPNRRSDRGTLHREDALLTFHLNPRSRWDFVGSAGISHFGYVLDDRGRDDVAGGSGFVTLGAGLNYHYKRIFLGVEVNWHPRELFRYTAVERPGDELELVGQSVDEEWDARRATGTFRFGVRL